MRVDEGVMGPGGGGEDSIYPLVGRCGSAPHILTLFKTKIADFPTLFDLHHSLYHTTAKSNNC